MKMIKLFVNGQSRTGRAYPGQTLLSFLRQELDCTEVKHGCGRGDCGACTVIMDGMLVDSCLVLALQAEGASILTAAGLGTQNQPHPVQKGFIEKGAIQCGFCTPGMAVAAKALLDEKKDPSCEEIQRALSGNLCRCTGYKKIIEAVAAAAQKMTSVSQEEQ